MDLRKYGVATHIYIPMVKRAVVDHAVGADWTPAAGDVKISKDGGAAANVTNLPTAIAMGNSAIWDFSLTATEMQAAKILVTIADSATKAVEDNAFSIITHGNASAEIVQDLSASVAQTGDSYARLGAPSGASTAVDIAAIKTDTGNLVTRITSTLFSGITQLSHWLGAIAGKQAANATAQTEMRATGAGSGTFDPTTDSQEALRDNLATASALATVQADTDDIQTRIPAALAADGSIKASLQSILGTAFTEGAAGRIAAGFKQFFNIASPAATMDHGILVDTVTTTTNLTNAPADSAGVTTLLARLGAFTGTGVNTVLGFLKAALNKAASTPSDVGGTFDPSTDSNEAIRDRGDAAWITATGFSTLDAAGIRTAIGLATNNLDTQLVAIQAQIPADLGAAYQNLSNVQATKVLLAALAGEASGLGTATAHFKKLTGGADVIVSTVDADGNRSAPTLTP